MVYCSKCGAQAQGNFCSNCGARLARSPPRHPPPPHDTAGNVNVVEKICNSCNGTGRSPYGRCRGCNGKGKVLVRRPPRKCGACNGTGAGHYGVAHLCEGCGGSGWLNSYIIE